MALLTIIAAVVLFYVLLVFLMHEMFRKFFHMLLFVSTALFIFAVLYFMLKGV